MNSPTEADAGRCERRESRRPVVAVACAVLWIAAYASLIPFADFLLGLTGLTRQSRWAKRCIFSSTTPPRFCCCSPASSSSWVCRHTFVSPDAPRAMLSGKRLGAGNVLAATPAITRRRSGRVKSQRPCSRALPGPDNLFDVRVTFQSLLQRFLRERIQLLQAANGDVPAGLPVSAADQVA